MNRIIKQNTFVFLCCTNVSSQPKSEPLRFPALPTLLRMSSACPTTSLSFQQPSRAAARPPQPGQDCKSTEHKEKDLVLFRWRQLVVNFLWKPLSAVVGQVGPDELLLGEAEDAKPAAFQALLNHVSRVRHYFLTLKDPAKIDVYLHLASYIVQFT